MSDLYDSGYRKEEEMADTPETALANWNAANSQIANFAPEAAQDLNQAEAILGNLLSLAEQAENVDLQEQIKQAWQIAQRAAQRIVRLDQTRQIAQTAIDKSNARARQIQEELDQINEALDDVETMGYSSHPRISGIIEVLEEQLEDYGGGLYIVDPGMEAHANGWYDCLSPEAVDTLTYALFGDIAKIVPTELREKLAEFVNSFGEDMIGVRRSRRARFMQALDSYDAGAVAEIMDEEGDDDDF